MVLNRTKRGSRAIEEFERALSIDPNLAKARASLGIALAFAGRAEETEAHVLEALRLSPREPSRVFAQASKATARYFSRSGKA